MTVICFFAILKMSRECISESPAQSRLHPAMHGFIFLVEEFYLPFSKSSVPLWVLWDVDANQNKTCSREMFVKCTGEREQEWAGRAFRSLCRANSCVRRGKRGELNRRRFQWQWNSDNISAIPTGIPSAKTAHYRSPTLGWYGQLSSSSCAWPLTRRKPWRARPQNVSCIRSKVNS